MVGNQVDDSWSRAKADGFETIAKSARARAIRDHAWTRRMSSAAGIRRTQPNLSERDLARSVDHHRQFVRGSNRRTGRCRPTVIRGRGRLQVAD